MLCNEIDGWSKKGTSNFKLREYNSLPALSRSQDIHINAQMEKEDCKIM